MPTDLFQRGARMLERVRSEHLAHLVQYTASEGSPIEIGATVDEMDYELVDESGFSTTERSRDFLIAVADLVIEGSPWTPQIGDLITETIDDESIEYEVKTIGNAPCWRFDDAMNLRMRIHTRRKGTAA